MLLFYFILLFNLIEIIEYFSLPFPPSKPSHRALPLGSLKERGDRTNVLNLLSVILRARISQEVMFVLKIERLAGKQMQTKPTPTNWYAVMPSSFCFLIS